MSRPGLWVMLAAASASGCGPSMPRGFGSPEPAARMDAILDAARRSDRSAVPEIVQMLESDDPATRFLAIRTLERLTGTALGYDYAAPLAERESAVDRWRRFVVEGRDGVSPGRGMDAGAT